MPPLFRAVSCESRSAVDSLMCGATLLPRTRPPTSGMPAPQKIASSSEMPASSSMMTGESGASASVMRPVSSSKTRGPTSMRPLRARVAVSMP